VLFRNEKREKPSQPEFRGEATIDGKRFWVAAWVKEKGDKKFFLDGVPSGRRADAETSGPCRRHGDPLLGAVSRVAAPLAAENFF
jgi:hypothetical protein